MKRAYSERQSTTDLKALAAAAQGQPRPCTPSKTTNNRETRIAELKARYQAGDLQIDEKAVASKLVDLLLESHPAKPESGS